MTTRHFYAPTPEAPSTLVVSSAQLIRTSYDRLRVWNRGALAGELVLQRGDGEAFAALLGLIELEVTRVDE